MQNNTIDSFKNASVPRAVISNIIPSIISMIMVLLYNLADTFFIGQTKNAYMVAAVSLATPAFLIFMAVGMLFGIGGTSLISRMLGAGKQDRAKSISSFCFWTSLVIGIISMIAIWIFSEPMARLIGASEDTLAYTMDYLNIVAVGIPFLIVSNAFSNIIRAEGRAKTAMSGMIIGNMANIVLDPIMILLFGWNVKGAAVATVLGNMFSAVFYLVHLLSKRSILSINIKDYSAGNGICSGVMAIGVPASLNSILMSVSNIVINNLMAKHGDMAVAGLGVAMKVNMIVVMLLIGLGSGIQPLLGYRYGAKNRARYFSVFRFSIILALILSIIMTVVCYVFAGTLVRTFLDNDDAFGFGMQFSRIYIISGPVLGILFVLINSIQSIGAAIPSLILSISRQGIIFMPILFAFNKIFDSAKMLAYAQPVTDYCAAALAGVLFFLSIRKYFREVPAKSKQ